MAEFNDNDPVWRIHIPEGRVPRLGPDATQPGGMRTSRVVPPDDQPGWTRPVAEQQRSLTGRGGRIIPRRQSGR